MVRQVRLNPRRRIDYDRREGGKWTLEIILVNAGGTTAHVEFCKASFQMYGEKWEGPTDDLGFGNWDQTFQLPPSQRHTLEITLDENSLRAELYSIECNFELTATQTQWPICQGTIFYKDDNGMERETGFARGWSVKREQFIAAGGSATEYQD